MATFGALKLSTVRAHIPRYGVPHVAFETPDDAPAPTIPTALTVGDLTMLVTVFESFRRRGVTAIRAAGGTGGWRRSAPADGGKRNDAGVKLSTVVKTLAGVVGETAVFLPGVDRVLGTPVARFGATARDALTSLCSSPSGSQPVPWHVSVAGVTIIGPRTGVPVVLDPLDGEVGPVYHFGGDTGLLGLLPGNTIEGRTIDVLRVFADKGKIRAEAIVAT